MSSGCSPDSQVLLAWLVEWIVVPVIENLGEQTKFGRECELNMSHIECVMHGDWRQSSGDFL